MDRFFLQIFHEFKMLVLQHFEHLRWWVPPCLSLGYSSRDDEPPAEPGSWGFEVGWSSSCIGSAKPGDPQWCAAGMLAVATAIGVLVSPCVSFFWHIWCFHQLEETRPWPELWDLSWAFSGCDHWSPPCVRLPSDHGNHHRLSHDCFYGMVTVLVLFYNNIQEIRIFFGNQCDCCDTRWQQHCL